MNIVCAAWIVGAIYAHTCFGRSLGCVDGWLAIAIIATIIGAHYS